jgi:glycosyltransferase involved in cell wall biosynthesis
MVSKILFLGSQMTVGGAQRVLLDQAAWFYENGCQVTAAFFYDKEDLQARWDTAYPFAVIDLKAYHRKANPLVNAYSILAGAVRLWRLLTREKFDIIETFTPDSNLFGIMIAWLARVPVRVATHHGHIEGAPGWRKWAHGWLVNRGFAQQMVAVSDQVRRIAIDEERMAPERVTVIPNGIQPVVMPQDPGYVRKRLEEELNLKPDDFIYLSVGRVTRQKGHTYLLDAIPGVLTRFPENTVFLIAGEGHLRRKLEEKAIDMGIADVAHFLGTRSDIPDLLSIADVFVLPSLWEGLPLALLEAMSVGLPVIATRVEGVESVITDGENGYLIPPEDVSALTAALLRARGSHAEAQRFGARNRDVVEQVFTIERMCLSYQDLFQSIYQQVSSHGFRNKR